MFLGVEIEVADWCVINLNVVGPGRGIDFLKLCKGIGATWVVAEGFHLEDVVRRWCQWRSHWIADYENYVMIGYYVISATLSPSAEMS